MKKTVFLILLAAGFQNCFAQTTTEPPKQEVFDHFIGVQVNGLIRQLFNSSASTTNPYLLTYSMNSKKSGWGIRAGIGYYSITNSNANTNGDNNVKNNDLQLRIGVEKVYELSKKWTVAAGIDIVFTNNDNNSSSNQYNTYDTTLSTTKTVLTTYGGGPFAELTYHITDRIMIGTEASFYYTTGTKNQTVDYTTTYTGTLPNSTETKSSPTFSQGNIALPVVIYLSVRF